MYSVNVKKKKERRIHTRTSPTVAKLIAASNAVSFPRNHGLSNVIFEGDALVLINIIKSDVSNYGFFGHIVDDIRRESKYLGSYNWFFIRQL